MSVDQWGSSWSRGLPVLGEFDVAVAGAGPAGVAAAVSSARLGARTILIESAGYPGGTAVHANVPHIMGFARNERQIVAGFAEEFARRLAASGQAEVGDHRRLDDGPITESVWTSIHAIRRTANQFVQEARVIPLYYAKVIGAVTDPAEAKEPAARESEGVDRRITALIVDRVEGPALVKAHSVVDATGDAVVTHRAGGKTRAADPEEAMTKTMIITLGGVRDFNRDSVAERFDRLVESGEVPLPEQTYFMGRSTMNPGEVSLNFTLTAGNALSSAELTRMDMELREQIDLTVDWFRRRFEEFAEAYLVDSAVQVGVRSGRVIVGRETITQADIDEDTPVAEPVGFGVRYYGDHGIHSFRSPWAKKHDAPRAIPWRALLSESFCNAAAAGRCISVEPRVVTCVRLIAQCMATGQAAGVTAALAAEKGTSLEEVGYEMVRSFLLDHRAILEL